MHKRRWLRRCWAWAPLAWCYAYIGFISVHRVDPDFGWHFRVGERILSHGIPYRDVFSYTAAGQQWVDHEWLNNVVMYAVGHWGGKDALAVLWALGWTAAIGLVVRWKPHWVTAGVALAALSLYVGVRSSMWTALGLAVMLTVLAKGGRWYFAAPVVMLVWANLHGGFAVGLVVMGLYLVFHRDKRLVWALVLSVPATLCNPYGWRLYGELWQQMSDGQLARYILEWSPLRVGPAVMPYVLLVITILLLRRRWTFDWVRSAGLVVAALWSSRHVPLLVVGSIGVVDTSVREGLNYLKRRWVVVMLSMIVGVALPVGLYWTPAPNPGTVLVQPERQIQALRERPCRGRVFNDYNFGGLIIGELPGVQTYIDGRMPSWRGPEGRYMDRYVEVLKGGTAMREDFARYNVQCALVGTAGSKISAALRKDPGWRLALSAKEAELWRRDGQ